MSLDASPLSKMQVALVSWIRVMCMNPTQPSWHFLTDIFKLVENPLTVVITECSSEVIFSGIITSAQHKQTFVTDIESCK